MEDLLNLAKKAKSNSYCPISNYQVGAVLVCKNNNVYLGTNIEDSSMQAGSCAERTAFYSAITNGDHEFSKLILIGGFKNKTLDKITPCGTCRQLISEFCNENFEIINYYEENNSIKIASYKLSDLLTYSFNLDI